jgi:hypothetical protein
MMRIAILALAALGILTSGFLGMKWVSDSSKVEQAAKLAQDLGVGEDPAVKAEVAKAKSAVTAGYLLMVGALGAIAASVMMIRMPAKSKVCGAALIACALIPALFAAKSLVFTFFLIVAGGLCLARKTAPAAAAPMTRTEPAFAAV